MRRWENQSIAETLVRPFGVIVLEVMLDKMIQMLITKADEVVQTHMLDRSNPALSVRVHDGSATKDLFRFTASRAQGLIKRSAKLLVVIANQDRRGQDNPCYDFMVW
jgi:hypothetical protein